jgi:hypothetical protein
MPRAERDLEHLLRPSAAGVGLEVAAVEPTAVQLVWSRLDEGPHVLDVGGRQLCWDHPGGPGSIVVDELEPSTELRVTLRSERQEVLASCSTTTSAAPPGARLCRIATISDLHLGRDTHHARHLEATTPPSSPQGPTPHEPDAARDPADRSPLASLDEDRASRCARAAITEAIDWGAQLIVVKGDVCEETVAHTWDLAAALLTGLPVPVVVLPGNHDTGRLRHFEPEHGAAARGLEVLRGVGHVDMPGLRVVAVDSTRPGTSWGSVDRHADEVAELVRSSGPALVATHHQPQRFTLPLYWPPGIPGPDARRFARAVRAANPSVLATSGHTHRNVRRRVAGMDWTEVASTSHYPGVWAGYTVHEGGLHQTVRRIADPATLEWSERTRRMLRGVWALWSAGSLEDRCFTKVW